MNKLNSHYVLKRLQEDMKSLKPFIESLEKKK